MAYWLKSRLTPVDTERTYDTIEEWIFFNDADYDGVIAAVDGLSSIDMVLEENKRTVVRTMNYDSVEDRIAHGTNFAVPAPRNPTFYSVEFISESEPTPNYKDNYNPNP